MSAVQVQASAHRLDPDAPGARCRQGEPGFRRSRCRDGGASDRGGRPRMGRLELAAEPCVLGDEHVHDAGEHVVVVLQRFDELVGFGQPAFGPVEFKRSRPCRAPQGRGVTPPEAGRTRRLLQQRAIRRRDALTEQLQTALNSRVLIEQAKGLLAERLHLDIEQAFTVLRSSARSHNRRLSELAQAIVDGSEQIPPASATSRPH